MARALLEASPIAQLEAEHKALRRGVYELSGALERYSFARAFLDHAASPELRSRVGRFREDLLLHFRDEEESLLDPLREALEGSAGEHGVLRAFFGSESRHDLVAHRILAQRTQEMESLLGAADRGVRSRLTLVAHLLATMNDVRHVLAHHLLVEDECVFPEGVEMLGLARP